MACGICREEGHNKISCDKKNSRGEYDPEAYLELYGTSFRGRMEKPPVSKEVADKIIEKFQEAQLKDPNCRSQGVFWEMGIMHEHCIKVSNATDWNFDEMQVFSEVFKTENINVVTNGCGTCGHGATIRVEFDFEKL